MDICGSADGEGLDYLANDEQPESVDKSYDEDGKSNFKDFQINDDHRCTQEMHNIQSTRTESSTQPAVSSSQGVRWSR